MSGWNYRMPLPEKPTVFPDHDAYAALRFRDFRLLISASFLISFSQAVLSVIVGYELYLRTGSALALGLVGLVQVVPNVILSMPAGQYVDQHDHRLIASAAAGLIALAAAFLALLTHYEGPLVLIYACLFLIGLGRVFNMATPAPLMASIVPPDRFGNAAAWRSSSNQTASILGPAAGGFGVAVLGTAASVFAIAAVLLATAALLLSQIRARPSPREREKMSRDSILAGIRFIRSTEVLLATITLDMVAVMLGGATALLPIFAEDVLHVGAFGLGIMRAAPAAGAVLASVAIAHKGPFKAAGPTILVAVTGFGLATILFGVSRSMPLSLVALALIGAFDAISMVIRSTLQLTLTPDHMRGRVGSVHYMFVGMSNEFGEFESGLLATLIGATAAVVAGGIGTILVVPVIFLAWPEVRRLREIKPRESEVTATAPATASSAAGK
jgi:MFS family permease